MPIPNPLDGLRQWQAEATQLFLDAGATDWLTSATPGAGKTTYSLNIARHMKACGWVQRIIVVCPTDHLRSQWVEAAARFGLDLRATPNHERLPRDADGCVVTYAQVAHAPAVHEARTATANTFVVFDEVHHAGDDRSWGGGVIDAFDKAVVRFSVTGTPFRSDDARIAHVTYLPNDDGELVSVANYTYGYGEALRDGVVRPVTFAVYSGNAEWTDASGASKAGVLGDWTTSRADQESTLRAALAPDGQWIKDVVQAAHDRVMRLRATTIPDAAVLIAASSQERARAYAKVWQEVTGNTAQVALSDDPDAADVVRRFRDDPDQLCLCTVRLVSEGVDIPRCAVLVWATTASTSLFFAQLVGRVVRARNPRERAIVFLPAAQPLAILAAEMETIRDHVLQPAAADQPDTAEWDDPDADTPAEPTDDTPQWEFTTGSAVLHNVVTTNRPPIPEDDTADELFGLDGLLTPEQERLVVSRAVAEQQQKAEEARRRAIAAQQDEEAYHRNNILEAQRRGVPIPADTRAVLDENLQKLHAAQSGEGMPPQQLRSAIAAAVSRRARDTHTSPAKLWATLYSAVPGPKNNTASVALLQRRYAHTRDW